LIDLQNAQQIHQISFRSAVKDQLQTILLGIALTSLFLLFGLKFPGTIRQLNNAVTDIQIGLLPKTTLSPLPVIVEVDEKSLAAYGQWPWPRYQVANLLETIQRLNPVAIGVDALFVEHDRTSPTEIQRVLERDFKQKLPLGSLPESFLDYDARLGQALATGPFVLSYYFTFDGLNLNACEPKSAQSMSPLPIENRATPYLYDALGIVCNIPSVQQGAKYNGFINSASESDGIFRKTPLLIQYKGKLYPSLALQSFLIARKIDHFSVSPDESGLSLRMGELQIPLDRAGNLLLKFPAKGQPFQKISAYDLLIGKIDPEQLRDKVIFLGFSAIGLHEFRPTPFDPEFLGVEVHATVVDNLARQDFLSRHDHAATLELMVAAILGLVLFISLANASPTVSVLIPFILIIVILVTSQFLLANTGTVLSPALPVIMTVLSLLSLALIKYVREYLRAKQMTLLMARNQEGLIESFCSMSEYRDPDTGKHIKRTQNYVQALAKMLQKNSKFKSLLTDEMIELLFRAAPLHDIGKIGVRDNILLKAGKLGDDEFEVIKSHPEIGADMLKSVAAQVGWNPFMQIAHDMCLYHQEKWDGSGYPYGLIGDQIPLPARLMALADVYDALISKRVYKPAFSHKKAISIIRAGKGQHFDPLIVEAFEVIHEQCRDIALQSLDNEEQWQTLLTEED
jgi:adenylate cyclase